jgi:hypothetical protein
MFPVSDHRGATDEHLYPSTNTIKVASIWPIYRCFDRILLNGLIQLFQQSKRVIGFSNAYRNAERMTRNCLRDIAQQFQGWLKNRCEK